MAVPASSRRASAYRDTNIDAASPLVLLSALMVSEVWVGVGCVRVTCVISCQGPREQFAMDDNRA